MGTIDAPVTFGDWIKQRRRVLDLTQSELADRAGCSVFALRKIESGERRPSKQLANLLANSLEISAEVLPRFLKVARGELSLERLDSPAAGNMLTPAVQTGIPGSRLPSFPNTLLGREPELAALRQLIKDPGCRLLTLTGPGGIGKTRLAVEVGALVTAEFADGVYFVSLAGFRWISQMFPAISDALGISFQGHDLPAIQLYPFLQHKQLLLIIDNAEHLLDDLIVYTGILENTAGIKILVTSRERLHLQEEWVFQIQGLPTPPTDIPENLEEFSSILLFMQAARRASSGFELDPTDVPAITRICRIMDGMPLGIELAAGWVALLSCKEIAHEVELSLDFLRTTLKNVPDRQRSLRAAFDYSWSLLPEEERNVLARLSVFLGGFERAQAEQVAGATLPILQSLIGRSLVRRKQNGRFDLHEMVRQYAYERLIQDAESEEILNKHASAYLDVLEFRGRQLKTADQVDAMRVLREEMNNVRAAWNRALSLGWFQRLEACIHHLGWFCDLAGWLDDGIELFEMLIGTLPGRVDELDAKRLIGVSRGQQGLLFFRRGIFDRALHVLYEALTLLGPINDPSLLTDPMIFKGVMLHITGRNGDARILLEKGLIYARQAGDEWHAGYAVFNLGYLDSLQGDYAGGYQKMLDGMGLRRTTGDPSTIALGLNHISLTALKLNLIDEARAFLEESIELCTQVGDRWGLGTAIRYLGLTDLEANDLARARDNLEKSLAILAEITTGWDLIRSNIYLVEVYRLEGGHQHAWKLGKTSFSEALEVGSFPLALEALTGLARLELEKNQSAQAYIMAQIVLRYLHATAMTRDKAAQIALEAANNLDDELIKISDAESNASTLESLKRQFLIEGGLTEAFHHS